MSDEDFEDINISQFIREAQRLVGSPPAIRRRIQDNGINVIPADYYSTVPSISELDTTFEGSNPPLAIYDQLFDARRIEKFIDSFRVFSAEFDPPLDGDADSKAFFWNNDWFRGTDAMAYYCIIRQLRPHRIIEIGGGFSTLVADAAVQRNGFGDIIVIDPYPREFLLGIRSVSKLIRSKVQELDIRELSKLVHSSDILFIDSTHTVKIGSDCIYIYLHLMPRIQRRLLVHSHDVFLPFGMRLDWARESQVYWTEQYLLYAYLLGNRTARVLFGSMYATNFLSEKTSAMMGDKPSSGGSSLWYELNFGCD